MSNGTLTKHEREVVIVVEKTLNSMILTRLTLAEIIDAAAVSALRSQKMHYDRKTPDKCACLYTLQIGFLVNDQMQEVRGEPTTAVN